MAECGKIDEVVYSLINQDNDALENLRIGIGSLFSVLRIYLWISAKLDSPMRGTVEGPSPVEGKLVVRFESPAGRWAMRPAEISRASVFTFKNSDFNGPKMPKF